MKLQKRLIATLGFASLMVTASSAFAQPADEMDNQPAGQTQAVAPEDYNKTKRGGLFVEPAVKYDLLQGSIDYPAPFSSSDVKAEGPGVGARLGFHISDIVFLAAEGNYSQLRLTDDKLHYSAKGNAFNYGPSVGVQTPWAGVRVWGTYLLGGSFDPEKDNNVDIAFKDMNGYRIGAGLRFAFVGASLEYERATYSSTELQNAGPLSGSTNNVKMTNDGWILGLSFPVTL